MQKHSKLGYILRAALTVLAAPALAALFCVTVLAFPAGGTAAFDGGGNSVPPPSIVDAVPVTMEVALAGPTITSAPNFYCEAGAGGSCTLEAQGHGSGLYPLKWYIVSEPPEGVSLTVYGGVLKVAGTVPAGEYDFTVRADNGVHADGHEQTFHLVVTDGAPSAAEAPVPAASIPAPAAAPAFGAAVPWIALAAVLVLGLAALFLRRRRQTKGDTK